MLTAVSTSTSGPSVDVHGWVAWLILLGAVALALVALRQGFTNIVLPIVRVVRRAAQAMETLGDIATEFRPNGQTLHDRLVSIDATTMETKAAVDHLHEQSREEWLYAHENHHAVVNALAASGLSTAIVQQLVDKLDPSGPKPLEDKR